MVTPIEQDRITCDGETGVVMKIHALAAIWVLECDE
jgi:hypothetical protein